MRILHTSDWHLGAMEMNYSLKEDQLFFIDRICEMIKEKRIDIVVIAGDIYDKSNASLEAMSIYDYAMEKLCVDVGVKVISIAGNHDSSDRLSNCNELLKKAGLYVHGALTSEPYIISEEGVDFYLLPWFTAGKVRSLFPDEAEKIDGIVDAYDFVCSRCRDTFVEGKKHIAISHAFVSGAELSLSDRSAEVGTAQQVPVSVFEGFDYVALGHIHKPQDVGENARYSGTPMPYSFGREENQEKSVTIIDTCDMSREIVTLPLLHRRKTVEGTYDEVMGYSDIAEVMNGYVNVHITDRYLGPDSELILRSVFPNMLNWIGKLYEAHDEGIHMTLDQFKELESNPVEIFKSFCRDVLQRDASEHEVELFSKCLSEEE